MYVCVCVWYAFLYHSIDYDVAVFEALRTSEPYKSTSAPSRNLKEVIIYGSSAYENIAYGISSSSLTEASPTEAPPLRHLSTQSQVVRGFPYLHLISSPHPFVSLYPFRFLALDEMLRRRACIITELTEIYDYVKGRNPNDGAIGLLDELNQLRVAFKEFDHLQHEIENDPVEAECAATTRASVKAIYRSARDRIEWLTQSAAREKSVPARYACPIMAMQETSHQKCATNLPSNTPAPPFVTPASRKTAPNQVEPVQTADRSSATLTTIEQQTQSAAARYVKFCCTQTHPCTRGLLQMPPQTHSRHHSFRHPLRKHWP